MSRHHPAIQSALLVVLSASALLLTEAASAQTRLFLSEYQYNNPAAGAVRIGYSLARPGPVSLGVYDPAGRRVRRLLGGWEANSSRQLTVWDGADDAGRPLGAGVYYLRLEWAYRSEGGSGSSGGPIGRPAAVTRSVVLVR